MNPLGETAAWHARLHDQAVEVPGPEVDALVAAAKRAGVIAVVGVTEREPGAMGTLYNTNVVVGPDGLLGKHRKLVATWGERVVWAGGDGSTLGVFPTPFGPLGTLNCGENLNSLARYALLAQGERIHVANFPSAAVAGARHTREELFLHVAPHAYEGKVFSICSSEYGTPEVAAELGVDFDVPEGTYNCMSGVIGPNGEWVDATTGGRAGHRLRGLRPERDPAGTAVPRHRRPLQPLRRPQARSSTAPREFRCA